MINDWARSSRRLIVVMLALIAFTSADLAARGRALRRVAENGTLSQQEFNRAFVLMQFFGYMRRNPNDPQDLD